MIWDQMVFGFTDICWCVLDDNFSTFLSRFNCYIRIEAKTDREVYTSLVTDVQKDLSTVWLLVYHH